ncbi:MAG TPA: class I SAM-dependent methyltransferase [Patescibacteria group bacterium]|nr:class I SAM-dependent methyltransferase [Patescibacteria group bacterium]
MENIKDDIRKGYDIISRSFCHTRNYLWREMEPIRDLVTEGEVLDLGCGNGRLYELFANNPKIQYTGVDFSEKLIEFARSRYVTKDFESKRKDLPEQKGPTPKFIIADITEFEIKPKTYNLIALIASYHHIPDRKERLELLKKVHDGLKENGTAIITIWNLWNSKTILKVLDSWKRKILRQERGGMFDIFYPFNDNGTIVYRYYRMFSRRAIRKELKKYFIITKEEKWKKGQNLPFYLKAK